MGSKTLRLSLHVVGGKQDSQAFSMSRQRMQNSQYFSISGWGKQDSQDFSSSGSSYAAFYNKLLN